MELLALYGERRRRLPPNGKKGVKLALDVGKALKSKTLVVGVLSMSLLMSASNAVSGTIPAMKEAFSDYSAANVELLTTVPTIGSMVGTALTGIFANAIGRKKIAR